MIDIYYGYNDEKNDAADANANIRPFHSKCLLQKVFKTDKDDEKKEQEKYEGEYFFYFPFSHKKKIKGNNRRSQNF